MSNVEKYEGSNGISKVNNVKGMENVDEADIPRPRVKLNQSNSPLVVDNLAKPGDYSNSVSNEVYGSNVTFQPIMYAKTRVKWLDIDESGWDCRSDDGKTGDKYGNCRQCGYSKWGKKDNGDAMPPACNLVHNFLSIIWKDGEERPDPAIIPFMRTSAKQGVQLINRILYAGQSAWARKYQLKSKHVKSGQYSYYVMVVDNGEPATKEEQAVAESVYNQSAGKKLITDLEDETAEFSDDTTEADRKTSDKDEIDDVFDELD